MIRLFLLLGLAYALQIVSSNPALAAMSETHTRVKHHYREAWPDCGPRALLLVCHQLGVKVSLDRLRLLAGTSPAGTSLLGLSKAANAVGLQSAGVHVDAVGLRQLKLPAIAWVNKDHYIAVFSVKGDRVYVHDPNKPRGEVLSIYDLVRRSQGIVLALSPCL